MAKHNVGTKNGMWKGGRTLASSGYVLIRVGVGHHLADVRGYAYEHRLVAERVIGRRLRPGEIAHHINGDKLDNRPENIKVEASIANHCADHRTRDRYLRNPYDPNPEIACDCGCGSRFTKYDASNRPRRFVSGHNVRRRDRGAATKEEANG